MARRFPPRKSKRKSEYRWLRSDGTPNFADHIHREPGDMELLAKRPVVSITPTSPIARAIELMSDNYRSLIVSLNNYLKGLLLATHIINYLGGGEYYNIVVNRHNYNIYSVYEKEYVETIMESNPIVAYIDEKLPSVLEKMVVHGIGILPVIDQDNRVYGVVTEHDLVEHLKGVVKIGVTASKIMSSPVITVESTASIKDVMEKMISHGFRRLPVVEDNFVRGIVTAMDIIRYFDPRRVFKNVTSTDIREVLDKKIEEVMSEKLVTVSPNDDLSIVVDQMFDNNVSSVLVVDEDMRLLGIITERDVLYALTAKEIG